MKHLFIGQQLMIQLKQQNFYLKKEPILMHRQKTFYLFFCSFRFIYIFCNHTHKETPLHLALQECKERMINFLLEHGADPNIRVFF